MDLYLKAGPDGKSVGDCPFAHYVRMVIHIKGLDCSLHPCPKGDSAEKPDWLKKDFEGKMPCLDDGGKRVADSQEIAEYLESAYPEPKLKFEDAADKWDAAKEAGADIFPAVAKLVKSAEKNYFLEKELVKAGTKFQEYWKSKPKGDYLLGDKVSLLDCSLAPKLYHLDVAVAKFHPDSHKKLSEECPAIKEYSDKMFRHEAFVATKYDPSVVVWGWTEAREAAGAGGKACGV